MRVRSMLIASVATLLLALTLFAGASAGTATHRASIRAGDCQTPGELLSSLSDLSPDAPVGDASPVGLPAMAEALGDSLVYGMTTVPMSLAQIGAGDHALGVVASLGGAESPLACGELARFAPGPADVQMGLLARDGSGPDGVAWLHDNGDGTTSVTVVLASPADLAEPAAASTDSRGPVEVAISASRYLPSPLEISVGTTVTWTNEDPMPHTTSAGDGGFDSGYMAQGDTFSYTFDAPGSFPIFCVYHPLMRAVVIVK